ncbi:MAG: AMP-binding protein, partial [Natronomonas sp.]
MTTTLSPKSGTTVRRSKPSSKSTGRTRATTTERRPSSRHFRRLRTFEPIETGPDTPGIIMYTSGSTGPPKGALHTQSVWLGHCPAFRMYFELDVSEAICWTPADWAWIGAMGDLLFTAWHYGRPVVG